MRPRDTQRQRLYDAEAAVRPSLPEFTALADVQAYVDTVCTSKWARTHMPRMALHVRVKDGRRRSRGGAYGNYEIRMPRHTRTRLYILHELVHCATSPHVAAHGREFAALLLKVVRHFLGAEAHGYLRDSFKDHGVKYTKQRTVTN